MENIECNNINLNLICEYLRIRAYYQISPTEYKISISVTSSRQDAAVPDQDDRQHPGAGGPAGQQAHHPPRGGGGRQLDARPGGPRGRRQPSCEQPCQVDISLSVSQHGTLPIFPTENI